MTIPLFSLEGKVAIVTGASRGIGRAIALAYAVAGAQLVMASRGIPALEKAALEVSKLGRGPLIVPTDIAQKDEVENLIRKTLEQFGRIDIMVNDPGMTINKPVLDTNEAEWDTIMNTNLRSFYLLCRASAPAMREKKSGSIINMASPAGYRLVPRMPVYSISKAGVIMLTKALAYELGPHQVRVNAIAPGLADTDFSRMPENNEAYQAKRAQQIPMRRIAQPGDMVGAALYLGSDASQYVNGTVLVVDGGDTM